MAAGSSTQLFAARLVGVGDVNGGAEIAIEFLGAGEGEGIALRCQVGSVRLCRRRALTPDSQKTNCK